MGSLMSRVWIGGGILEEHFNEYEVFENYTAVCSKEEWDRVVKWIHETY